MTEHNTSVAVVGAIEDLHFIKGADRIMLAGVDCGSAGYWSGVVGLDMTIGEKVTTFLQDALLPSDNPRWAFMASHKFRVRMARFRGVPSECVIIKGAPDMEPGTCLMEALGVTKYSKPLPKEMAGQAKGNFPYFIPKTDESNFQSIPNFEEVMIGDWYATEKADGTSSTVYMRDDEFGVCSRNLELKEFDDNGNSNLYWKMARHYRMDRLLDGLALQFEIVGPHVQGNPLGLAANEIRVFTLYDHTALQRMSHDDLLDVCNSLGLPAARLITMGHGPLDADALRKLADIKYPNGEPAEGVVIRALDSTWSFKVLSLSYVD